jgi:hypothetical protein
MKITINRDSVHPADDFTSHIIELNVAENISWEDLIFFLWESSEVPKKISGGEATWALSSKGPIAVAAQQWKKPRLLFAPQMDKRVLLFSQNTYKLYWSYLGQIDPEIAFQVLSRMITFIE